MPNCLPGLTASSTTRTAPYQTSAVEFNVLFTTSNKHTLESPSLSSVNTKRTSEHKSTWKCPLLQLTNVWCPKVLAESNLFNPEECNLAVTRLLLLPCETASRYSDEKCIVPACLSDYCTTIVGLYKWERNPFSVESEVMSNKYTHYRASSNVSRGMPLIASQYFTHSLSQRLTYWQTQ